MSTYISLNFTSQEWTIEAKRFDNYKVVIVSGTYKNRGETHLNTLKGGSEMAGINCKWQQMACVEEINFFKFKKFLNWDSVKVLDNQPHLHQRLVLESIHIRSQSKPLNRDKGSMPQIYNSLFSK